jgi:hypothetical protein
MWRFLLIFLVTAAIVQFLYRDKNQIEKPVARPKKKSNPEPPKQQTVPVRSNKRRGEIFEPNGYISNYGIAYYDINEADSDYEYLSSQGYQGGGSSWEGILYGVLKIKDPDLLSRVEFDAEGDGLVINGENKKDMEGISFWINEVKTDRKLMQRAIMMANIDGRME